MLEISHQKPMLNPKFIFFGSSRFSEIVLDELKQHGLIPVQVINSAKGELPELATADFYLVASFGKILDEKILNTPQFGSLNIHPSLLPKLRGPAPIQGSILGLGEPGISIIKMDALMDHGPLLIKEEVPINPFPDHYAIVEEKLARAGARLLIKVLPEYLNGTLNLEAQDDNEATFIKLIKKEDGHINLEDNPEENYRKVLAYSTWPGAYIFFKRKTGDEIRVVIKNAKIENGHFIPLRVIPAGKKEMSWEDFLRGNA